MSGALQARELSRWEFAALGAFVVVLPLVEAPKNIFWGLFVVLWLANSVRQANWGSLSRGWNALLVAVLLAPIVSVVASAPYPANWHEMADVLGYVSLAWLVGRSRLSWRQVLILMGLAVVATLLGFAHGVWFLIQHPERHFIQLNSVGHVNHSALYAMGSAVWALSLALVVWGRTTRLWQAVAAMAALSSLGALVAFGSRGAMVAVLMPVLILIGVFVRQRRWPVLPLIAVGGLVVGMSLALNPQLITKTLINVQSGQLSSYRVEGAHTALEMARHDWLTGVGATNFSKVSPEQVQQWVEARGEVFKRGDYLFSSHAHTLYFNTLAERGLIGEAAILALAIAWAWLLWRRRPQPDAAQAWLCWGAGLSGFALVFVGGAFNTTLHHEHGMLAMLSLGLLLSGTTTQQGA